MQPYNHFAENKIEACCINESEIDVLQTANPHELLNFDKRLLAYQAVQLIPRYKDKAAYLCSNTKFRKNNPVRVNKHVHPELNSLIVENLDNLQKAFQENLILFSFSGWHIKVIGYLQIFYNKFSKTVEFVEMNYTKEEIILLIAVSTVMRENATKEIDKISKLKEDSKDMSIKALLKALGEDDDVLTVTYEGKELSEEELEITSFDSDKVDRDIDQNISNELWLQGSNTAHIYGVSSDCMMTSNGLNAIKEAIQLPYNGQYTDMEKACLLENITEGLIRAITKKYGEDILMIKMLIELQYNKTDWRHQVIMHDRVSRVMYYRQNNMQMDDIEYIIDKVL